MSSTTNGRTGASPSSATGSSAGSRKFISEMSASERITGLFSISNAQLGRTRQDKPYLKCIVGDRTGELPARMWSIDEATFRALPTDGFAMIEGETQPYQGELQVIIHSINPADPTNEEMRDLLPCAKRPVEEMFGELVAILGTLQHPAMKALVGMYLEDKFLMDAFKQAPAAKSMHHAYLGGLLEHTLTLLKLAELVCPLYPKINREIVIVGLFLHDLGKTRELVYDRAFGYSDRGELIGHLVEGAIMLHDKSHQLMREHGVRLPPGTLTVLQHIIISHHGVPEFGAAKIPATPEAILVAQLDNLDAKTTMAVAVARPERASAFDSGGNFTERNWALDTKIFRPDVLAEKPAGAQ
jgi:3'-5' exoribonuclease